MHSRITSYNVCYTKLLRAGLDGRGVYAAFAKQTDTWLYDTADFVASNAAATTVTQQQAAEAGDEVFAPSVQVKAAQGTKHTASDVTVDVWGNRLTETAYGVAGEDEAITSYTSPS